MPALAHDLPPDRLDRVFHALADSRRRGMIDRLARGPATVKELARPFDLGLPAVMKHLAVLEDGGLVTSRKSGRVRTVAMTPDALDGIAAWAERRKAMWNRHFDTLDAFLDGEDNGEAQ